MNVTKAIVRRRNIKQFTDEAVSIDDFKSVLSAASQAPNHKMAEPWEIVIVGPETRKKFNHKANFGEAPMVFAILSKPGATPLDTEENLIATSCFTQNLLLAAWEQGFGARWASIGSTAAGREVLCVPDDVIVVGVFGFGHPAEIPAAKTRTPIEEKMRRLP